MPSLFHRLFLFFLFTSLTQCSHLTHYQGDYHYIRQPPSPAPTRNISVFVDSQFGDADKVEITKAVEQWNYALNGYLTLNIVSYQTPTDPETRLKIRDGGGLLFVRIKSNDPLIGELHYSPLTLGFVYPTIGGNYVYLIRDRLWNESVKPVSMHEIGHALGAIHTDGGLMNPTFYPYMYQCIDQIALEEVAEYQRLPANKLNWCYYGEDSLNPKQLRPQ